MEILSKFGERLSELMFYKGISCDELAVKMNIAVSNIRRYLRNAGTPTLSNLIKLAGFFNCSVDFLLGFGEETAALFNSQPPPFSERLKEVLKRQNCSRYRLKKGTGLAKQSVDDWFYGRREPSVENLIVLADYFECSIDYLLGREK